MPKKIQQSELNHLINIIATMNNGASVGELFENKKLDYTRRTLQRRLEDLLASGDLITEGNGRSRRYFCAKKEINMVQKPRFSYTEALKVSQKNSRGFDLQEEPSKYYTDDWMSEESRELKRLILLPLEERKPVGYNADFLHDYIPNETFYITEETRQELAQIGQLRPDELPPGTYLRHIMSKLIIDLSWNSSRLEGNTYSILETRHLLNSGEAVQGRGDTETLMILNHKAAIEMLADQLQEVGFNRYTLLNLHAALSEDLLTNDYSCGRVRSMLVGINGSVYQPLGMVPQVLDEHFDTILKKASMINDPVEASFFIMVHLPYLQPFEDVNKRTSRLAANIPMVLKNLCPLSFVGVDAEDYMSANLAVYELNRIEYLRDVFVDAYKRSCLRYSALRIQVGDPDPFRMKYRTELKQAVRDIVLNGLSSAETGRQINEHSEQVPEGKAREIFADMIQRDLTTLHEGSIMRYRIRPSEFTHWKENQ